MPSMHACVSCMDACQVCTYGMHAGMSCMACMHICHACIQASRAPKRSSLPYLEDENGIEHRVCEDRALVQGWLKPRPQPLIKRRPQRLLEAHYNATVARIEAQILNVLENHHLELPQILSTHEDYLRFFKFPTENQIFSVESV